ncbi:unnamed protein product [Orchesella dallaii]|uniref:SET domain-containing protein n=1 Tax=Orchesella dallaii TaxID=48710 RepID=A0ABP1QQC1_9HEXA
MSESEDALYEVQWSQELGRYLVAVRDIKAREIIIREDPLMSGPTDRGPKDVPVCLGCCNIMSEDSMTRCTNCHWPVCNEDCEKLPLHAENECQIFHKNRVVYPPPFRSPIIHKCVFILRCLLLKSKNLTSWEKLNAMADNGEERRNKPICINSDKKIMENFRKFFPNGDFSEEDVIRISGIVDVNAHSFPIRINDRPTSVCNLYSRTSLMAHSCIPNASWSADKSLSSLTLTIRANVPISKGEMISVAYVEGQLLVCTLQRLIPNEINGMFICRCPRCLDPTENSTYIGALKCPSCEHGYLLPIDPVDSFSSWKCDNGNNGTSCCTSSATSVANINRSDDTNVENDDRIRSKDGCSVVLDDETIMEMIEEAEMMCGYTKMDFGSDSVPEESLSLLKEFVEEYSGKILHPNHYILQEVDVRILKGEFAKGLRVLSDVELIQFLERCERLFTLSNALTPGYCEYRAFLQFHFSQGLLSLEKRKKKRNFVPGNLPTSKNTREEGEKDANVTNHVHHDDEDDSVVSTVFTRKFESSLDNLNKVMEMLTYLLTYFEEINSTHKLLEPIKDTITDTEKKLKRLLKQEAKESSSSTQK